MVEEELAEELVQLCVELEAGRDAHHPMQQALQLKHYILQHSNNTPLNHVREITPITHH